MPDPVYCDTLNNPGIDQRVLGDEQRQRLNRIIFDQLVKGEFLASHAGQCIDMTRGPKEAGCDAVIPSCREIPLLGSPEAALLPTLDSTRIWARAVLPKAVED